MTNVLIRDRGEDACGHREEGHMTMEAETEIIYKSRNSWNHQKLEGAVKDFSPRLGVWWKCTPADL